MRNQLLSFYLKASLPQQKWHATIFICVWAVEFICLWKMVKHVCGLFGTSACTVMQGKSTVTYGLLYNACTYHRSLLPHFRGEKWEGSLISVVPRGKNYTSGTRGGNLGSWQVTQVPRLSHWVVDTFEMANELSGLLAPSGVQAQSAHSVAPIWPLWRDALLAFLSAAVTWLSQSTFSRHYSFNIAARHSFSKPVLGETHR